MQCFIRLKFFSNLIYFFKYEMFKIENAHKIDDNLFMAL
jgi:hypothetical protein